MFTVFPINFPSGQGITPQSGCNPLRLQRRRQPKAVKPSSAIAETWYKKPRLDGGPLAQSAPRPHSCRHRASCNHPQRFKQDRWNYFAAAEFRTKVTGTPSMAEFDTGRGKSVAKAVRQLIRSEDNRRHLHDVLNLAVDLRLPSTLAPLLEALDQTGRESFPQCRRPNER